MGNISEDSDGLLMKTTAVFPVLKNRAPFKRMGKKTGKPLHVLRLFRRCSSSQHGRLTPRNVSPILPEQTAPSIEQSVESLPPQRSGFQHRLVPWVVWQTKWHCVSFISEYPNFPPVKLIPPILHFHVTFTYQRRHVILATESVVKQNNSVDKQNTFPTPHPTNQEAKRAPEPNMDVVEKRKISHFCQDLNTPARSLIASQLN